MLVIGVIIGGAILLIGMGLMLELRTQSQPQRDIETELATAFEQEIKKTTPTLNITSFFTRWQTAVENHPAKAYGIIETGFWVVLLLPLLDHLFNPETSFTAWIVWWVIIFPHEIGHLLCAPFGTFIMFLGGSIWQVLVFILFAVWLLAVRRYLTAPLFSLTIVGHSFMNMSVYIRDASDRNLDLLFGLDKSHHDWWNILGMVGLLDYDWLVADIALGGGFLIGLSTIGLGIWTTWVYPRRSIGPKARFGPTSHPPPYVTRSEW